MIGSSAYDKLALFKVPIVDKIELSKKRPNTVRLKPKLYVAGKEIRSHMSTSTKTGPRFSFVLETPASDPETAHRHFATKLQFETDAADVMHDLNKGNIEFTIIDTRSPQAFELCHIPGAVNLPKIDAETTRQIPKDKLCVVYCWGPGCNGATKGAMLLSELGFRAKELIGGIEYWRREGGRVEGAAGDEAPLYWRMNS